MGADVFSGYFVRYIVHCGSYTFSFSAKES
jgi:hypothetical protein